MGPIPFHSWPLAGGAGQGHRHIEAPARTPIGNLWVGVANKFGSQIESLGESTGALRAVG